MKRFVEGEDRSQATLLPERLDDYSRVTWHRVILHALLCVAMSFVISNSSGAMSYSAQAIEGWVIDAETQAPLEGVVVLAHWDVVGPLEGNVAGEVQILETVTDANGRYVFPAWGPVQVPNPLLVMFNNDPAIHYFKRGYRSLSVENIATVNPDYTRKSIRSSDWNGKRVALQNFHGDDKQYAAHFIHDGSTLIIRRMVQHAHTCEWQQMPSFLSALLGERRRLSVLGFSPDIPEARTFANQSRCGDAEKWLEDISK